MPKNGRRYDEAHLDKVEERRRRGATPDDVPALLRAYRSDDWRVRLDAVRRSCPCHVPWEVYEQLRKAALRLRDDPNQVIRQTADHLEEDARKLAAMEARIARARERDDELAVRFKPSGKKARRREGRRRSARLRAREGE